MSTALVIDDQDIIQKTLTAMLKLMGYNVITTESAEEALQLVQTISVDLILLDLVLPQMKGSAACVQLKKILPSVPIIGMSGYTDRANEMVGISAFLYKPFDFHELKQILARLSP